MAMRPYPAFGFARWPDSSRYIRRLDGRDVPAAVDDHFSERRGTGALDG